MWYLFCYFRFSLGFLLSFALSGLCMLFWETIHTNLLSHFCSSSNFYFFVILFYIKNPWSEIVSYKFSFRRIFCLFVCFTSVRRLKHGRSKITCIIRYCHTGFHGMLNLETIMNWIYFSNKSYPLLSLPPMNKLVSRYCFYYINLIWKGPYMIWA